MNKILRVGKSVDEAIKGKDDSFTKTLAVAFAFVLAMLILLVFLITPGRAEAVEINISKIITMESSGNPHAYNKRSGCIGLMQINPKGALVDWNNESRPDKFYYNTGHLYDPAINVRIGKWYINNRIPEMFKHYKIADTVRHRLISFNWGIGNLRKYLRGEKKLPKETKDYIRKYYK